MIPERELMALHAPRGIGEHAEGMDVGHALRVGRPLQVTLEPAGLRLLRAEENGVGAQCARLFAGEVLGQVEVEKFVRRDHDLEVIGRRMFLRWLIEAEPRRITEFAKSGRDQFADLENEKVRFGGREKIDLGDQARRRESRAGNVCSRFFRRRLGPILIREAQRNALDVAIRHVVA